MPNGTSRANLCSTLLRQLAQTGLFLRQHVPGDSLRRSVFPGIGHLVAPLQGLPVEIGVIGEAERGPQVAPHVFHPALNLPFRLRPVGLAQLQLEPHLQGKVQHPNEKHHEDRG